MNSRDPPCTLVRWAASKSPPDLQGRLEEEWLCDLTERRGALARWRFALGCCWAMRVIAHEHAAAKLAPAGAATQALAAQALLGSVGAYSRRTAVFAFIVALHVVFIYLFATGLAARVIHRVLPPLSGGIIQEPHRHTPPEPVPAPDLGPVVVEDRLPPPLIPQPEDAGGTTITTPSNPTPVPVRSGPPGHQIQRVMGGPDRGFPNTEDFYPPAAIRQDLQGVALLRVCVDASGRLSDAPAIVQSTGFPLLDRAAAALARAGSGHYRPTTEDGQPVASCYAFRINFSLRN